MSLNHFFTYFGAKAQAARYYPPPLHDTIVEPFAGSAGYSVRYHRRRVILVEKNPLVATVWRYLIGVSARELLRLPDIPAGVDVPDMKVCPEARLLIGFNVGSVSASPGKALRLWAEREPHSSWGPVLRARLAGQVEKIRHWKVIEGDYSLAPDIEATWFVDPPYEREGNTYPCAARDIDFPLLGNWCRTRRGQVMVCENEGAAWLPFRRFRMLPTTANKRNNGGSVEVIWTNDEKNDEKKGPRKARRAS